MIIPARVNSRGNVVPAFQIDEEFAAQVLSRRWSLDKDGYLVGRSEGRKVSLHRFVWAIKHGSCPAMLDHVFRNPLDNRIENLRPADFSLNNRNNRRQRPKHSLPSGVHFHPGRSRPYQVRVKEQGRYRSVGYYATPEEASAVFEAERSRLIAEEAERCRKDFEATTTPEEKENDEAA